MRGLYKLIIHFVLIFIGVILIGAIPGMFTNGVHLSFAQYFASVKSILESVFHAQDIVYLLPDTDDREYKVFPAIWSYYQYSATIFWGALLMSFATASCLAYITYFLSNKIISRIRFLVSIFETVPDIFIVVIFQLLVVITYQKTGILFFEIASASEKAILLPMLCLSILPSILLFRVMLVAIEDEKGNSYIDMAKAKGLTGKWILLRHIVRNAILTIFNHSKSIFLILLSNLVILERLFNIYGLTWFMLVYPRIENVVICLILFLIPIYLAFFLAQLIIEKTTGQRGLL